MVRMTWQLGAMHSNLLERAEVSVVAGCSALSAQEPEFVAMHAVAEGMHASVEVSSDALVMCEMWLCSVLQRTEGNVTQNCDDAQ